MLSHFLHFISILAYAERVSGKLMYSYLSGWTFATIWLNLEVVHLRFLEQLLQAALRLKCSEIGRWLIWSHFLHFTGMELLLFFIISLVTNS
jgi:hypothetical protein